LCRKWIVRSSFGWHVLVAASNTRVVRSLRHVGDPAGRAAVARARGRVGVVHGGGAGSALLVRWLATISLPRKTLAYRCPSLTVRQCSFTNHVVPPGPRSIARAPSAE
jgi:hypothetical protein